MPPAFRDVVIRSRPMVASTEFLVTFHDSGEPIAGPFESLADAVAAAHESSAGGRARIWHESVDHRGRSVGLPVLLTALPA